MYKLAYNCLALHTQLHYQVHCMMTKNIKCMTMTIFSAVIIALKIKTFFFVKLGMTALVKTQSTEHTMPNVSK